MKTINQARIAQGVKPLSMGFDVANGDDITVTTLVLDGKIKVIDRPDLSREEFEQLHICKYEPERRYLVTNTVTGHIYDCVIRLQSRKQIPFFIGNRIDNDKCSIHWNVEKAIDDDKIKITQVKK